MYCHSVPGGFVPVLWRTAGNLGVGVASCDRYAGATGDAGLDTDFGEGPTAFDGDTVLIGPDDFKVNGPW